MPLPKYYCEYCDRAFNDTPQMRKKHFESKQHKVQVKMHYDSYKNVRKFVQFLGNISAASSTELPPSLRPPPPGGYPKEEIVKAQWG